MKCQKLSTSQGLSSSSKETPDYVTGEKEVGLLQTHEEEKHSKPQKFISSLLSEKSEKELEEEEKVNITKKIQTTNIFVSSSFLVPQMFAVSGCMHGVQKGANNTLDS